MKTPHESIKSPSSDAGLIQAFALLHAGRYAEASSLFTGLLKEDGDSPSILHPLGWLAGLLGDLELGCSLIRNSLHRMPRNLDGHRHAAAFLLARGKPREAVNHALTATRGSSPDPAALYLAAKCMEMNGNAAESLMFSQRSLASEPAELTALIAQLSSDNPTPALHALEMLSASNPLSIRTHAAWAMGLLSVGETDAAASVLRRLLWILPTHEESIFQLGNLLADQGRSAEAAALLKTVLKLNPMQNRARTRLGTIQMDLREYALAEKTFRAVLAQEPNNPDALSFLASTLSSIGKNEEAITVLRTAICHAPQDCAVFTQYLSLLNYSSSLSRSEHFSEIRRLNGLLIPAAAPQKRARVPAEKVRLGYVSGDFRNHSAAFFIEPQLEHTDRSRFHVVCYHTRPERDAYTARILGHADEARFVHRLSRDELYQKILQDRIDVLIDCSTHTAGNRLETFALRPAPVQMTMIGQMQTTGLDAIDYRISDSFLSPPDADAFSSERIVRLQSGPMTFRPPLVDAPVLPGPAQRGLPFTFGSTNDLLKINDQVLDLWAQILHAAPSSRFVFFAPGECSFAQQMITRGVAPERLQAFPKSGMPEFLQRLGEIDICLDPFPYNGLTVTLLSCWMGLPCVTLEGRSTPARAGAAVLRRIGVPEFICADAAEYTAKAIALSENPQPLFSLRTQLRDAVKSSWCRPEFFMRELEEFILSVV